MEDTNLKEYEDIINLPHYEPSSKHPRMSIYNRSAIFAPFAALTGYSDEIKEVGRATSSKIELDEDLKNEINDILSLVNPNTKVKITYFLKDLKKKGGKYLEKECYIKKIDYLNKELLLVNKEKIKIEDIIKIEIIE